MTKTPGPCVRSGREFHDDVSDNNAVLREFVATCRGLLVLLVLRKLTGRIMINAARLAALAGMTLLFVVSAFFLFLSRDIISYVMHEQTGAALDRIVADYESDFQKCVERELSKVKEPAPAQGASVEAPPEIDRRGVAKQLCQNQLESAKRQRDAAEKKLRAAEDFSIIGRTAGGTIALLSLALVILLGTIWYQQRDGYDQGRDSNAFLADELDLTPLSPEDALSVVFAVRHLTFIRSRLFSAIRRQQNASRLNLSIGATICGVGLVMLVYSTLSLLPAAQGFDFERRALDAQTRELTYRANRLNKRADEVNAASLTLARQLAVLESQGRGKAQNLLLSEAPLFKPILPEDDFPLLLRDRSGEFVSSSTLRANSAPIGDAPGDSVTSVVAAKLLVSLTFQAIGFFFLVMYRSGLSEIKYYENEMTNVEMKSGALVAALMAGIPDSVQKSLEVMATTERNFLLKRGETTVDAKSAEHELSIYDKMLHRLSSLFPSRSN